MAEDEFGFAVPSVMQQSGHLLELFGNISDSTFDGSLNNGAIPTGKSWGTINDWYPLRRGCGEFGENLNLGFRNPLRLPLLYRLLPDNVLHRESAPLEYKIPEGGTGKAALQARVERIFSDPVQVNSGGMVVIFGRRGHGATDNETQVNALMGRKSLSFGPWKNSPFPLLTYRELGFVRSLSDKRVMSGRRA
jgi:hypothetical protein